ncbi:MAG: hypothetical protein H0S85_15940 [Desulfovibrionaceae bacterium]|jgi:hypothetical protein|nr:hypothetical protein [Desulfovibrionaceae bacterium]
MSFFELGGILRRTLPLAALLVFGLSATAAALDVHPGGQIRPIDVSYTTCVDLCRESKTPAACSSCCDESFPEARPALDRCVAEWTSCKADVRDHGNVTGFFACEQQLRECQQRVEQVKHPFTCGGSALPGQTVY